MKIILKHLLITLATLAFTCLVQFAPSLAQHRVVTDREAVRYVGQQVTVLGIVANVYTSRRGNTFLNFGKAFPNQTFAAVIFISDSRKFHDLHQWQGKA